MQNDILLVAGPECHTLQSNAGVSLVDGDDASSAALLENESEGSYDVLIRLVCLHTVVLFSELSATV